MNDAMLELLPTKGNGGLTGVNLHVNHDRVCIWVSGYLTRHWWYSITGQYALRSLHDFVVPMSKSHLSYSFTVRRPG